MNSKIPKDDSYYDWSIRPKRNKDEEEPGEDKLTKLGMTDEDFKEYNKKWKIKNMNSQFPKKEKDEEESEEDKLTKLGIAFTEKNPQKLDKADFSVIEKPTLYSTAGRMFQWTTQNINHIALLEIAEDILRTKSTIIFKFYFAQDNTKFHVIIGCKTSEEAIKTAKDYFDVDNEILSEKIERWERSNSSLYSISGRFIEWSTETPEYIYLPDIASQILLYGTTKIFRVQHSRSDVDYEIVVGAKSAEEVAELIYNSRYADEFGKYDFDEDYEENEEFIIAQGIWHDIWERTSGWSTRK